MSTQTPPLPPAGPAGAGNPPPPPAPARPPEPQGMTEAQQRTYTIVGVVIALALIAGSIWAAIKLAQNPAQAATVRDVFIIFMALESMVIGVALVVLMVQLAVLTNLLRHEIKPILEATQETVNTVRGTAVFVSENVVEPIMKLNSYVAGLEHFLETIAAFTNLGRRRKS